MEAGHETDTLKAIKSSMKSNSWVSQIPIVYRLHELLKPIFGNNLAATARNGSIRQFTATHVQARQTRGSHVKDIYQRLLEIHHAKPDQFGLDDVVSMAATNVFAGSDTTAVSLRAIIYFLLKYPECKRRLVEEVDEVFGSTESLDDIVPFDISMKMPYLQAVIYEALRLHPVVGQTLPRVVPRDGLQSGKYFIPQGVRFPLNHNSPITESTKLCQGYCGDVSIRHELIRECFW